MNLIAWIPQLFTLIVGEAFKNKLTGAEPVEGTEPGKGLVASKTAWGVVVMAAAPWALAKLGWQLPDGGAQAILDNLVIAAGALVAIVGRIKAARPIGKGT